MRCVFAFLLFAVLVSVPLTSPNAQDPTSADIRTAQEQLKTLGYYPGLVDGIMGPQTKEAIKEFEQDQGLEVDGEYDIFVKIQLAIAIKEHQRKNTPEGRAREAHKQKLQSMPIDEIETLVQSSSKEDAQEIFELLGERAERLSADVVYEVLGIGPLGGKLASVALKGLYYPGSETGARQFQKDIGAEPTGELTIGQLKELQRRYARFKDTEIHVGGFGDQVTIYRGTGYVSAEGTWVIEGDDDIAFPVNKSKIVCRKYASECLLVQADVMIPSVGKSDDSYMLSVDYDFYDVVSWNQNEVIAQDSGDCRVTTLTINSNSNEIYEITRNNETESCQQGFNLPSLETPRIARMVPGYETVDKWWDERRDKVSEFANPRFIDEMKEAFEALRAEE